MLLLPKSMRQISEFVFQQYEYEGTLDSSIAGRINANSPMASPTLQQQETTEKKDIHFGDINCQHLFEPGPPSTQKMDTTSPACYMCMDNLAGAVLIECGHGGLCIPCASALWRHGAGTAAAPPARRCPLCRRPFVVVMRIVSQTGEKVACHPHYCHGSHS